MAQQAVVDAVEKRLAELWSAPEAVLTRTTKHLPACPFVSMNVEGDVPEDGSEFGEVQFPVATNTQTDLAGNHYREDGTIRLIVNAQRGAGLKIGQQLCEALATIFRSKKFDGVQTFTPSSPAVDDRNDNGLYFPVSISVPYRFNYTDFSGFTD